MIRAPDVDQFNELTVHQEIAARKVRCMEEICIYHLASWSQNSIIGSVRSVGIMRD